MTLHEALRKPSGWPTPLPRMNASSLNQASAWGMTSSTNADTEMAESASSSFGISV